MYPGLVLHYRESGLFRRYEGPELRLRVCGFGLRTPWCIHPHPLAEQRDFRVFELAGGRHLQVGAVRDCPQQDAFSRIAGRHRRTALATLEQVFPRIELESTHARRSGMARHALPREDRADVLLEKLRTILRMRERDAQASGETKGEGAFHLVDTGFPR